MVRSAASCVRALVARIASAGHLVRFLHASCIKTGNGRRESRAGSRRVPLALQRHSREQNTALFLAFSQAWGMLHAGADGCVHVALQQQLQIFATATTRISREAASGASSFSTCGASAKEGVCVCREQGGREKGGGQGAVRRAEGKVAVRGVEGKVVVRGVEGKVAVRGAEGRVELVQMRSGSRSRGSHRRRMALLCHIICGAPILSSHLLHC